MRIIGGTSGGATLKVPKGLGVRPTPDKVRLAIFNSLAALIENSRVLELFAGTGALGLECISRGASSCVFVELSNKHANIMKQNAKSIGISSNLTQFRVEDAFVAIKKLSNNRERFDYIFADPPYGEKNIEKRSESFAQQMLDDENLPSLLKDNGSLILGHTKRDSLQFVKPWELRKTLKHGDTLIEIIELTQARIVSPDLQN
ncbi:MAG: 16S rRNA (guanine(966)-N(2))-methyltransferase RsmD [Verrucomicrobiota bacterium]|nr:16S rRNA (guanine(966)-N(2))-methyltransferase RsmD [Verrucomicrobiota bacterium]